VSERLTADEWRRFQGENVASPLRRTDALSQLSDDYSYRVNLLLDEGREDLARELAEQYEREGLALLVTEGAR